MIFNGGMTIWILAMLLMGAAAMAGWRQGAIRTAFSFVGIIVAALLAVGVGRLIHPLVSHLGVQNPVLAWAAAPITGFILISAIFKVVAQVVHNKVEVFYQHQAGDLRLALWERLNARLGICLGLANGAMYFVLITFLIFNLSYWTVQVAAAPKQPPIIGLVNQLGNDLQATGMSRTAAAVGTLPPMYYQLADLSGLILQNPAAAQRLADYPGLTSLWERDEMQPLLQDSALTNALASGTTPAELFQNPSVRSFLANQDLTKLVMGILQTNLDDLSGYLQTGKSAKYDGEKIIGRWELNVNVTLAWMRQNRPRIAASEMVAARTWMTQAYAQTRILATGDNQLFVKSLPQLKAAATAGQPPTTEYSDWKGDWTHNQTNYDLHISSSGQEKFMSGTADDLRLTIHDGKNLLIYNRVD